MPTTEWQRRVILIIQHHLVDTIWEANKERQKLLSQIPPRQHQADHQIVKAQARYRIRHPVTTQRY